MREHTLIWANFKVSSEVSTQQEKKAAREKKRQSKAPPKPSTPDTASEDDVKPTPDAEKAPPGSTEGKEKDGSILQTVTSSVASSVTAVSTSVSAVTSTVSGAKGNLQDLLAKKGILGT